MKSRLFLASLCCALIACCSTGGKDFSAYRKEKTSNLPYRILFPEQYDRSKTYPLILFLHGAGERGDDNESQLANGGSLFLKEEVRKKYPAIIVFPQCPDDGWWGASNLDSDHFPTTIDFDYSRNISLALQSAIDLTKKIIKNERVDATRVYIMGLSMGGMGTFEAVYRNPDLFAAAIPICGGGDVKAYDDSVAKVHFWIFHGAEDDVVDVNNSRKMFARLKELRADVKYTEYPDVGHESWDRAFDEPELLDWLFSKQK
jgi:predicted peptidase